MSNKEPWTEKGSPWKSESAFWSWVRGVLRKGWSKHPIKLEYIKQHRKQIVNPNPKGKKETVWGMTCEKCHKDTVQSDIEIDHRSETGGKFTCLDDVRDYVSYLFLINFSSIRALCKTCHSVITHCQKTGLSFEEAKAEKMAIAFLKENSVKEQLAYLQEKGYNSVTVSNAAKRRAALKEIFLKEEM